MQTGEPVQALSGIQDIDEIYVVESSGMALLPVYGQRDVPESQGAETD